METVENEGQQLSATALREWTAHAESIMRGLAHALNNRAAALSAIVELAGEPDDDPAATRAVVASELERVRELVDVARFLGPATGVAEALDPVDVARHVRALLRLHSGQRERDIRVEDDATPVRVPRWMLQRALLVLCASSSPESSADVTLSLRRDGDWLLARVNPMPGAESAYVDEISRAMGGEPVPGGFRIPTLEALRRRAGR